MYKSFYGIVSLKGLDGLSNGYDNIALRIDDWQNASQNRAEYIKRT